MMTFKEFVAIREGLMSLKPPVGGANREKPRPPRKGGSDSVSVYG